MKAIVNKMIQPFGLDHNQASGFLDFVAGVAMVILPWFYVDESNIRLLAAIMVIGSVLILYAIFTDYRRGIIKSFAKSIHNALDLMFGVTIMALFPVRYTMAGLLLSFSGVILFLGLYLL